LRLTQSKVGRDEEVSKALSHAVLEEVPTQALHHLFVLEAAKGLLKDGGELDSMRCLAIFRSALPPVFMHDKVARGRSAWRVVLEGWHTTIRSGMCWRLHVAHLLPVEDKAQVGILVFGANGRHHPL